MALALRHGGAHQVGRAAPTPHTRAHRQPRAHVPSTHQHQHQHHQQQHRQPGALMPLRAAQQAVSTSSGDSEVVPQGCSRYSISIKKPLGLVLEQNKDTGVIVVAEIAPEGNAAKTGLVAVGDQLVATSGVTYSKESDYGGAKVLMGQEVVRLNVMGQSFKTVSAAIGSHPGHMEVKLEFQRC